MVHPEKYWRNAGAKPGDVLILTKPIGSGVLFNANLKGWVSDRALEECLQFITTLNRKAVEVLAGFEVHAATDITGFGLAGHAGEMAQSSDVTVVIDTTRLPVLAGAAELAASGNHTRASKTNRSAVEPLMRIEQSADPSGLEMVFDAQTSGGLLISVDPSRSEELVERCCESGAEQSAIVGEVDETSDVSLVFTG